MLFYSKRSCALLTLKNALRLQKKKKKTANLWDDSFGNNKRRAHGWRPRDESQMPDTYGHFGRVFFFFFLVAYTTLDLRTFRRTCVHVRKECSLEISVWCDVDFVESHQMELWRCKTGLSATLQFDLLPDDPVCTREFREEDREVHEHDGDPQAKAGVAYLWSDDWTTTRLDCIHSQAELFCTQAKRHTDLRNVTSASQSEQLVPPCH